VELAFDPSGEDAMQLGMIGLGKMGLNMTRRLLEREHRLVVFDLSEEARAAAAEAGASVANSVEGLVRALAAPRAVWIMVPAGEPTEATVGLLAELLDRDDVVIDGGNSFYRDSMRRGGRLAKAGVQFIDVGTSGGVWGLEEGYSLMIGGEEEPVERLRPVFEALAPAADRGWGHVGPTGAGHFVKMVHNGIEYGLMQAYAEGFELMRQKEDLSLDVAQIAEVWRHGSVVRSWLLDLTAGALAENPNLDGIASWVPDSGEGRWTVAEGVELAVPLPVITLALQARFRSRSDNSFADKLLAAMRNAFGGHTTKAG
jgi:6-phosphogluconate dehydrogenase